MILEGDLVKIKLIWIVLIFSILYPADYYLQSDTNIKTPWIYISMKFVYSGLIISFIAKELLRDQQVFTNPKLLILVPLMLTFIIFDVLQLYYAFFYDFSKREFFLKSYSIYKVFLLFSYISYTIAFLWAPRKEAYL